MKAKIVYCQYKFNEDGHDADFIPKDSTDWEEITSADMEFLRRYIYKLPSWKGMQPQLLVMPEKSVAHLLTTLREVIAKEKADEAARQKKAEEAKKRREKSALRRKQKQLEKLKKELGAISAAQEDARGPE